MRQEYFKPANIALLQALGVIIYCLLVAWLMNSLEQVGNIGWTGGALFLLLFVFSAGLMALTVFGYPAYIMFKGHISEGLKIIGYTLGYIFVLMLAAGLVVVLFWAL
ncbi:MAG: hypothetical protein NUV82_01740 [Candidatus Komeilibacteria bacterium]|nr:hypothetical protein [Candidatus Komeilibacteria bacterium]